ncbi:MAG TPA: hypothetical protein VEW93_06995 [Acidimicrobiales bacterium]|nr:hypothetical protein [Acidimicrobiales bacterium]
MFIVVTILATALVFALAVLLGVRLLLPVVNEANEEARIQRETQAASWRIHQSATQAFGDMLEAARQPEP